jgi:hypothetical protein
MGKHNNLSLKFTSFSNFILTLCLEVNSHFDIIPKEDTLTYIFSTKSNYVYMNSKRFIAVLSLKCMDKEDWTKALQVSRSSKNLLNMSRDKELKIVLLG